MVKVKEVKDNNDDSMCSHSSEYLRRKVKNSPKSPLSQVLCMFKKEDLPCTINCAPPRSPEHTTLLATKSGWLVEEDETGAKKRRYCCVVPHTFLYYFDEEDIDSRVLDINKPNSDDDLIRFNTLTDNGKKPSKIIDLESFVECHQSKNDDHLFELRSNYSGTGPVQLRAESEEEAKDWTRSLLYDRYSSAIDEIEAYQQVCEGAKEQEKHWESIIDEIESKSQISELVTKNIRGAVLSNREKVISVVRDTISQGINEASSERSPERANGTGEDNGLPSDLYFSYKKMLSSLDHIEDSDVSDSSGVVDGVKVLANFATNLLRENASLRKMKTDIMRAQAESEIINETTPSEVGSTCPSEISEKDGIARLERKLEKCKKEKAMFQKTLVAKNLDFVMQLYEAKGKNEELKAKLDKMENRSSKERSKSAQTFNKLIDAEKEKRKELESKVKSLGQRVKLQASIIECMMNNKGDTSMDVSYYEVALLIISVINKKCTSLANIFYVYFQLSLPNRALMTMI